jgi:glutamate carboxypeptidase
MPTRRSSTASSFTSSVWPTVRDHRRVQIAQMLEDLAALVQTESPTADVEASDRCADAVTAVGRTRLGVEPERLDAGGHPALVWRFGGGPTRVLLVGHFDTVWPMGTLAELPFDVRDGRATGPGVFDMKAGIVQGIHALASLGDGLDGVAFLLTSDEELGSLGSRELIEREARGARAALVLEPSADGALKTARKGVGMYAINVRGRAAHAGLEPEKGINALVELSHQVLALAGVARPDAGTTVTPTVARAGTTTNVVPEEASVDIDVRCATPEEQARVDRELKAFAATLPGAEVTVTGSPNRPPMPVSSSKELFDLALSLAPFPVLGVEVGGGSDGNFTAGVGTPTLDGLGAVGDGAHARHEWTDVEAMVPRATLLADLVRNLTAT